MMEEEIPSRKVVLRGALAACAMWTPILPPAGRDAKTASDTPPAASAPSGSGAADEPAQAGKTPKGVSN